MESVTYVCYSKEDLAAQAKPFLNEIQNMKQALLKVAENDTNAGTLEEIKALLGMTAEDTASAPSQGTDTKETTSEGANTSDASTDTKSDVKTAEEPSTEPHTVTVQPGDTLQTLAEKTGATPRHLIDMNMLMEPVVLRPGQSLKY